MADAYLEKTSQELKEEGCGTTNIAFIANEGCGAIYICVDSRTTSSENRGFILGEESHKYLHMKSCNVFATRAGKVNNSRQMLEHYFSKREEIVNGIHGAPVIAKEYIRGQTSTGNRIKVSTLMGGWDVHEVPYVYEVSRDEFKRESKSSISKGFASGSGGPYVTKTDAMKVYDQPILQALFDDHYDALARYLSNSLFFLFDTNDYKYTHDINAKVNKGFERQFIKKKYKGNVVIKRGTTYIVRLVHFNKRVDKLYAKLKRKTGQRTVPREFQDLESVEIEKIDVADKVGPNRPPKPPPVQKPPSSPPAELGAIGATTEDSTSS
ncbi:unnamed protein product [Prunus armeniaca]|uniref:Uncharacterized protein n=1 Tax=Prunus armeniaca TaxID=36596 RepID=A0A6J5WPK8_PRUAR|nr:unnamed protein product [Prunus armeniaca]